GGVFCLVTEDNQLISGPKSQKAKDNQLFLTDAKGARVATFNDTSCAGVTNGIAYHHTRGFLKSITLGTAGDGASEWAVETPAPSDLIVSSGAVILGHAGGVKAYSRNDGSLIWETIVPKGGAVQVLAISGNILYASDSHGTIRAYGSQ
ncbi:MAG: PQQ-binding-like beta-propeller repeat protein, partial [Roseibacillus sp.]|nr:PQQ-binding-like beta-propeller repeat protein [Roseibacillus sp.]